MSMEIDTVGNENGEEKRIPIGGDLYNSDASSEKSSSSTTPVTCRKSQRITSKQTLLTFSQNTFNPRRPDVVRS